MSVGNDDVWQHRCPRLFAQLGDDAFADRVVVAHDGGLCGGNPRDRAQQVLSGSRSRRPRASTEHGKPLDVMALPSSRTTSSSSASSETVRTAARLMTSFTNWPARAGGIRPQDGRGPSGIRSTGRRRRIVPVSERRRKSPSVTIPTNAPAASTTGRPLNFRCSMSRAACTMDWSGEMFTTFARHDIPGLHCCLLRQRSHQTSVDPVLFRGAVPGAPGLDIDRSMRKSSKGVLAAVERALIPTHRRRMLASSATISIFRWVVRSAMMSELFMIDSRRWRGCYLSLRIQPLQRRAIAYLDPASGRHRDERRISSWVKVREIVSIVRPR